MQQLTQLTELLLSVEKPARYVGGEFGQIRKDKAVLDMAIAFPDLYEIGMSNQALKILYKNLNAIDGVRCERVFAPALDFEEGLAKTGTPLFTLESGISLLDLDILGVTLGYELGITGMLSILQSGHIPLIASERTDNHPIVLLGGPAASNPLPFSLFVDGVWVGEAEDAFFALIHDIKNLKQQKCTRKVLLNRIYEENAIWVPGKKARRSVDKRFSEKEPDACVYPIPNMKIIQDHGAVEIMRGCPNGCRFCHAGVWYRPMRQKSIETIEKEVESFIKRGGYREISLSSLSSGDYSGISKLVTRLNEKYKKQKISFQLPSLKVSSFSLPLLETISEVRKSGLTFAIETPLDIWQLSINKEVALENVISILREAKLRGWKQAKFYFMIGLPVPLDESTSEEKEIIAFMKAIKKEVNLVINVNIGTFVPKAHTPFQWCPQITEGEAHRKLKQIRDSLRPLGFKVSTHDPFVSVLEGLISRGDERIGDLVLQAFLRGCRLDAWEDFIKKDIWRSLIDTQGGEALSALHSEIASDAKLPWDDVFSGVGKNYLIGEFKKSVEHKLTSPCRIVCDSPCGVCDGDVAVNINDGQEELADSSILNDDSNSEIAPHDHFTRRIVFSFFKKEKAIFWPHLSLVEIFSKAFIRASIPVQYSEGFNPLPKLDFAAPLSVGVSADNEIATIDLFKDIHESSFIETMNAALPEDIRVLSAMAFRINEGAKKVSAASMLWGFLYEYEGKPFQHPASEDKKFKDDLKNGNSRIPGGLRRKQIFARDSMGTPISYFDAYKFLYLSS